MKYRDYILKIFLVLILFFPLTSIVFSQDFYNYIPNSDFNESTLTGLDVLPEYWSECRDLDKNKSTDAYFEYFNITSLDSSRFILLKTRSIFHEGYSDPGTKEGIYTRLKKDLEMGYCYDFTVDLAWVPETHERSEYPVTFQLSGAHIDCSDDRTVLFESEPIDYPAFKTYHFSFELIDANYEYIYIEPNWDTVTYANRKYDGILLIDNIILEQRKPNTQQEYDTTVYFTIDPPLQLTALEGDTYYWKDNDYLTSNNDRTTYLLAPVDSVLVIIDYDQLCPIRETFHIIKDCSYFYENEFQKETDIYYKYNTVITLPSSHSYDGIYSWSPSANLSDTISQNPEFLDYKDIYNDELTYSVTITDIYGCPYKELVKVRLDCDSLYSLENPVIMLDTIIEGPTEITLQPQGEIVGYWSPADYLSCTGCQNPVASPVYFQEYTVNLIDRFECPRTELYRIDVKLTIPNVITPNGDGKNDYFIIEGIPENTTLLIFEKSGRKVFSQNNYGHEGSSGDEKWWNGQNIYTNSFVENGTYWYVLLNKDLGMQEKGFVFVVR